METNDIMRMASEGRASELRDTIRRRALGSLYYFTKVLCSYDKLSPHFHLPLCLDIQNTVTVRKRGYLWPRKHFKSTIIAKSYSHWRLVGGGADMPELMDLSTEELLRFYKTYPERDPRNLRIGIVGETSDVAEKDLKDIKDRTLTNELFRWVFPEIIPEAVGPSAPNIKWTGSEIVLPRTLSFDESTITCMGVGAKRTGFHYNILIYDDIIGEAASHSEPIMQDALDWLKAAPGLLVDDSVDEELIAGTRWKDGQADVYGWLMHNMPYVEASASTPSSGFKFSVMSCYVEPTKEVRFKERFSADILEDIRKRAGDYLFNCNYRNMPTPPEGSKLLGFKFYDIMEDGEGRKTVAVPDDGTPTCNINSMARMSFYDPSSGGKGAWCENAVAIVGTDELNRNFVLSMWSSNVGYAGAIEAWHDLNDHYVCWRNCYEQVGPQKEIAEIVLMRSLYATKCPFCGKSHRRLAPDGIRPTSSIPKEQRIEMYLEPVIRDGRLYLRREHAELVRQLTIFPNGDLVDQVDALAYCVKFNRPYHGIEAEMDQRDRAEAATAALTSRIKTKYQYGGYI